MNDNNKIDKVIDSVVNEVSDSKRVKQGASFIKKLIIPGIVLFILWVILINLNS